MDIRYVIRHQGIRHTPTLLAHALGSQTRRWPNHQQFTPSLKKDFLFNFPEPHLLEEAGDIECLLQAGAVHAFFRANKPSQRQRIAGAAAGIPVPWCATSAGVTYSGTANKFVVRPLRHSQGANYRVTDNPQDFIVGQEYISELFQKTREYRIVYVYGQPVVVLRKRVPEGTDPEKPWNHTEGSSFRTINDVPGSFVSRCGAIEACARHPVVKHAHIVGVDVLWRRKDGAPAGEYVVLEFNAAPALTIENNIETVANFIKGHE